MNSSAMANVKTMLKPADAGVGMSPTTLGRISQNF